MGRDFSSRNKFLSNRWGHYLDPKSTPILEENISTGPDVLPLGIPASSWRRVAREFWGMRYALRTALSEARHDPSLCDKKLEQRIDELFYEYVPEARENKSVKSNVSPAREEVIIDEDNESAEAEPSKSNNSRPTSPTPAEEECRRQTLAERSQLLERARTIRLESRTPVQLPKRLLDLCLSEDSRSAALLSDYDEDVLRDYILSAEDPKRYQEIRYRGVTIHQDPPPVLRWEDWIVIDYSGMDPDRIARVREWESSLTQADKQRILLRMMENHRRRLAASLFREDEPNFDK